MITDEERRDYKKKQDALNIKVGERVLICRSAHFEEMGWDNSWLSEMNNTIDTVGIVKAIHDNQGIRIENPNGSIWGYPYFVLKFFEREA